MSDSDSDVPALVPSSDEEDVKVIKTNAECVDIWLSKNVKFLEKQGHNVHIFSLGPFIMGLDSFISKPWLFCLYDAKLLNEKIHKEKTEYTKLTEEEWQNLDVVDVVTKLVVKKMRKRKFLVHTLDMVDKIEEFNRGDGIDVKHALQIATRYPHINESIWEKALSLPHFSTKVTKVKFASLYICKLCHMMVTSLAREGKDVAEDFKKLLRSKCGGVEKALEYKDQGNQQYSQQKFGDAIKLYTDAIKSDPFNHLCYGNRAQAFQKLDKFYEALADGRRAVLMKPDWIKGYYRYAQAFYHTGKLDMAIAINKKGMRICEKTKNNDKMLSELKDQGNKLQQEKDGVTTEEALQQILSSDSYGDDLPPAMQEIAGLSRVINIETALKKWSHIRHNQDASVLLSSDDHDSSDEEPTISYKEAKQRVLELNKKPTKDPEPEKLSLNKSQGKTSKSQKGRQNNKMDKTNGTLPPAATPVDKKLKEKVEVVKKNENREIETYMAEGSSAFLNNLWKKAVTSYQKALDLLTDHKPEEYGMDEQDVAVLEYAYGLSEISTGIYKHILDGIERLKNITKTRKDCRLALPYYGLGKAYIALNRFEEAIDPLTRCRRMADTLKLSEHTWPGTDTKMEESMSKELQKKVKELLTLTRYPPPPDAICKVHSDSEDSRAVIFFSDPDFKGFVRIVCLTSCIIEFHNQCWKDFKSKFGEKPLDKDILEKPCPTPDCMSCIVKIIIFRQDSIPKEITLDKGEQLAQNKAKKPSMKLPLSSQDKIEKKKEKKELRRQRKREMKEEADDFMDDIESAVSATREEETVPYVPCEGTPVDPVPLIPEADIEVIKKTDQNQVKISKKAAKRKNKKKRDKAKQVLNVEVNFGDGNEKQLLGENSVPDETQNPPMPGSKTVENTKQQPLKKAYYPKAQFDEIAQNLFSFFEDLLKAYGPLHINDAKITSMLEDFPPDAKTKMDAVGGLSKFLLQSTKFAMHGEIVCLREDAHKASKISKQQSESFASKASKLRNGNGSQSVPLKLENPWTNDKQQSAKLFETNNTTSKEAVSKSLEIQDNISGTKKFKVSCMDTLDDFDFDPNIPFEYQNTLEKTNESKILIEKTEYPKISVDKKVEKPKTTELAVSMDMDAIDDIDLIPVKSKTKKIQKKNKGMDDLDDFDFNVSDSDSFKEGIGNSDRDSVSSREDSSKIVGREKMDLNKLDSKLEKPELKTDFTISRSSSKSDISERSDLSVEIKLNQQKMPEIKPSSMWPARERTLNSSPNIFGPIGSPVPSDKFESKNEQSEILPSYSSYSNDKNGSILLMDTAKAAEREKFKIDAQYVQELTEEVMKDMTFGKSFTEKEKKDLYKQVSQDIWNDFKRTSKKPNNWSSKTNETGYEYTTNKNSYTEQYMKNFYQKKTTDPSLTPESFSVVTSNNLFYGDSTFSNSVSTSNSGWPQSESLSYPGFQTSFTPSSVTTTVSSFLSANTSSFPSQASSIFSPMPSNSDYQSPFLPTSKPDLFGNWSIGISVTQSSSNMTTSPQALNTFPGNYTSSVFSNPFQKFQLDKSVHAFVETCTVSINTDPYEPLKDEFQRMKKEYDLLQSDLTCAITQKQELANQVQETDHKLKTLEMEISIKNDALGKERQSMQEKHDMLYLEWNHISQQLPQLMSNEKELKLKILKLEEEKRELMKQKSKERQEFKYVEDEIKKRQEEFRMAVEKQTDRATKAEVEILNLRKQAAVAMLERSKKEAMYHVIHLKGLHKKHQDQGKEVPSQILQALSFYDSIVSKCTEALLKLMGEFDEQIKQVQNGKCLSELPTVFVPPPPPSFTPSSTGLEVDENTTKPSSVEPSPTQPSTTNTSGLTPISVKGPTLLSTPRPLVPPQGPQSLRQQISRSSVNDSQQSNGQHQPKNSFEKLLQRLTTMFPQYNRSIYTQLIQQLRQSRGGSLSGLTIEEITNQVTSMIQAHEKKQTQGSVQTVISKPSFPGPSPTTKTLAPPPGLSSSWAIPEPSSPSSYKGEEMFEEEQDPCVICHEEMTQDTTVKLECNHRFHDECIRKWLRENSTCPNCRIYALLPDEFPTLM